MKTPLPSPASRAGTSASTPPSSEPGAALAARPAGAPRAGRARPHRGRASPARRAGCRRRAGARHVRVKRRSASPPAAGRPSGGGGGGSRASGRAAAGSTALVRIWASNHSLVMNCLRTSPCATRDIRGWRLAGENVVDVLQFARRGRRRRRATADKFKVLDTLPNGYTPAGPGAPSGGPLPWRRPAIWVSWSTRKPRRSILLRRKENQWIYEKLNEKHPGESRRGTVTTFCLSG